MKTKEKENKRGKAVIYTRFSPRPNADTCESCEKQEAYCRVWARENDYEIRDYVDDYETRPAVFSDPNFSGKDYDRENLWNAVASLKRGDILLAYSWDRLARDVMLCEIIKKDVRKKGCEVVTVDMGECYNKEDELIQRILMAVGEYERKVIAFRTKMAMLMHQKNGRRMGHKSKLPYGFMPDPGDEKRLLEQPGEQGVIELIMQFHFQALSLRQIAKELEDLEIDFRGRDEWHHQTISNIIKRERVKIALEAS